MPVMKDLKHYFSSPREQKEQINYGLVDEDNTPTRSDLIETLNIERRNGTTNDKSKKKKRKRKLSDSDFNLSEVVDDIVEVVDKKKRVKTHEKNKVNGTPPVSAQEPVGECLQTETTRGEKRSKSNLLKSKKSKDSGSSKENSTVSDTDEKVITTPENTKNLFSYFNKVDKLSETVEKPRKIKVEVLVHADLSGSPPDKCVKTPVLKKKKSKKRKSVVDYDLITSEEIYLESTDIPKSEESAVCIVEDDPAIVSKCKETQASEEIKINGAIEVASNESNLKGNGLETKKTISRKSSRSKIKLSKKNGNKDSIKAPPSEDKPIKKEHDSVKADISKAKPVAKEDNNSNDSVVIIQDDDPKVKPLEKEHNESNDSVIIIEEDVCKDKPKMKHNGTLASFFNVGNRPPPLPLEKRTSAKLQFLLSGSAQPAKRISTIANPQGNIAPFPPKSHFQQKDKMNILWNLSPVNFDFKISNNDFIPTPLWCSLLEKNVDSNISVKHEVETIVVKKALKELKKELNLFPISCWIKELKKMRKGNESFMWTERYRPHSSSSFLANLRSISKLKAWLTELKETSIAESGNSSGEEFVRDTDIEHQCERKTVTLLTGPPGTGKTASVYAIAEEIGYNVLEINASCNRSGKRILNEFSEAMQSHKVGVSKLNFTKAKKKHEEPKRSLILIEDADLLFEDDEGFVPTMMNLGASTKRPIILVANNPQAKHFGKLTTLFHSTLEFIPPTQDRLGSWLRTVSAVEGFHLKLEESTKLACSKDLRKSLLQLQLTQSNAKANIEDELEIKVSDGVANFDLTVKNERRKAEQITSALSALDIIRQKKRSSGILPYWHKPLEDSTLNVECKSMPSHSLEGIETTLLGLMSPLVPDNISSGSTSVEVPRNLLEVEKDACSAISILNRRGLALDYWAAIRNISRSETARLATHTKRNNRYFNYLSSVGVRGPPDLFQALSSSFS